MNCVGNGKILKEKIFENIWIQPAAGDAGSALGVALCCWYQMLDNKRVTNGCDTMKGAYLGPHYKDSEIKNYLDSREHTLPKIRRNRVIEKDCR